MDNRKNGLPIIALVFGILGFILMMSATPFDTDLIGFSTFLIVIGLILGIISIFNSNYKKVCAIIGIILCLVSFFIKTGLDDTRNSSITYKNEKNTENSSTLEKVPASTSPSTTTPTITSPSTTTTTLKNYQQIYNEYSQKLINAGPTSSMNEMATICNEGIGKMAQYMYSASGTDGQYATYQSWVDKLYQVYINNCR